MTSNVGFWGPVTSTVDWCEANYQHSPYIAEFFNTTSSIVIVAIGLCGYLLHRKNLERRFLLAFLLVSLVGLGSIAFHATLRFEFQMLDELPMLYTVLVMTYILIENRAAPRFGIWFPVTLAAWGVVVTALTAFTRGNLQFYLFQFSFGSLEMYSLYRVYRMKKQSDDPHVHALFRTGMGLYATAIGVWFTDLKFCGALASLYSMGLFNPQLHAVWHVLVSLGMYTLLMLIAYQRARVIGTMVILTRTPSWLPRLRARTLGVVPE